MNQLQFLIIIQDTPSWPGGLPTDLPTDDELHAVSMLVAEESAQLKSLDDELTRLKAIVKGLEEQRSSLSRNMEAHQAYISPARRLPDDVLREIMIRCIPIDPPPSHSRPHEGPPLLAHICSHWRAIALSTPEMWSKLCVSFRLRGPRLSLWDPNFTVESLDIYVPGQSSREQRPLSLWQKDVDIMRYWISLAKSCPLTLSFGYFPDDVPFIDDIFQLLIEKSSQWESIDLIPASTHSPTLPFSFCSAAAGQQSPLLYSIRFPVLDVGPSVQKLSWTHSVLLRSPRLHMLTCRRNSGLNAGATHPVSECNSPLSSLPINHWQSLTTISISCQNAHEVEDCIMVLEEYIGNLLEVLRLSLKQDARTAWV